MYLLSGSRNRIIYKKDIEVLFISIISLMFIYRTALPCLKYPFILLYATYLIYFILFYNDKIQNSFSNISKAYLLIFILLFILLLSIIISNKIYLSITKDFINALILLSIFLVLAIILDTPLQLINFKDYILTLSIIFASIFTILNILSLWGRNPFFNQNYQSINIDYNFASIPIIFGFVAVIIKLQYISTQRIKILYNFLLITFSLGITLSGSKRGLFILALLIVLLFVIKIIQARSNKQRIALRKLNVGPFLIMLISSLLIICFIVFHTSGNFKNNCLTSIGIKNLSFTKKEITVKLNRFIPFINYSDLYKIIWSPYFDPTNPDSGWGTRIHKTVDPLPGNNVVIVPENTKGYLMDSTCNSSTWGNNAYSFTIIGNDSVNQNEAVYASVYCYVSKDFNGQWIRISSEESTFGYTEQYYNLNHKGSWQKLYINPICKKGKAPVYLYFSKYGVTDFSTLKGQVIFAYPEYYVRQIRITSLDPDSGWGTRKHKTVFPLTGEKSYIIPDSTKGYLMDCTCNASTWNGNAYSFTKIGNDSVAKGDLVNASVFCFVSEDFNGEWVRISSEGSTTGKTQDYYDLNNKGVWQQLKIEPQCGEGKAPVYLYFAKYRNTNFSNLKGYVIFAYPCFSVIRNQQLNDYIQKGNNNPNSFGLTYKNNQEYNYKNDTLYINLVNNEIRTSSIYFLKDNPKLYFSNIMPIQIRNHNISDTVNKDNDLIRKWIARLVSEDTTYYPYKADIHFSPKFDNFIAERIDRWQFGLQIYKKEYNWQKKLLGGGFAHLNWYGYYFYNDKTKSDWPHNPFISVLLYSGVLGLILYLYLIYKVFAIYIKYIKEYYILFVFFCITFFFSFFSAGNPFDPPVMGFLVMLPFLIDYIHKHDKSSKSDKLLKR